MPKTLQNFEEFAAAHNLARKLETYLLTETSDPTLEQAVERYNEAADRFVKARLEQKPKEKWSLTNVPQIRPGVWKHYKGAEYRTNGVGIDERFQTWQVYYTSIDTGMVFNRLASEWLETVKNDEGQEVSRFTWIRELQLYELA